MTASTPATAADRYPTVAALANGGQAPVAVESGKRKHARFRWAGDHRLRAAIGTLAGPAATTTRGRPTSTSAPERAAPPHQHAIRILGRAWCGVIWRLWHDHDTYDPNRHIGLQRLLTASA